MDEKRDRATVLMCDGREVPLVPFVEAIVRDTVLGLVGSLKGVDSGGEIVVRISPKTGKN